MPIDVKQTRVGQVTSDRMQKTVVVAVKVSRRHPLYGKALRSSHKYKAHDAQGQCRVGDTVRIAPSRPLSGEKRWRVVEVLSRKGEAAAVRPVEEAEVAAAQKAAAAAPATSSLALETVSAPEGTAPSPAPKEAA